MSVMLYGRKLGRTDAISAAGIFAALQSHFCTKYRLPLRLSSPMCFLPSQSRRMFGVSVSIFMTAYAPGSPGSPPKNQRHPTPAIRITRTECRLHLAFRPSYQRPQSGCVYAHSTSR